MLERIDKPGDPWITNQPCFNPSHNPPQHMHYAPGTYRWTCPGCGKSTTFTVPKHPLMTS